MIGFGSATRMALLPLQQLPLQCLLPLQCRRQTLRRGRDRLAPLATILHHFKTYYHLHLLLSAMTLLPLQHIRHRKCATTLLPLQHIRHQKCGFRRRLSASLLPLQHLLLTQAMLIFLLIFL